MQNEADITQLCVKIRRQKMTYFFLCKPYDRIEVLKLKLLPFFKEKALQPGDIRFYIGNRLVDDKSNLHDQDIRNNSLVYFKLRKGNTGQWQQFPELGI